MSHSHSVPSDRARGETRALASGRHAAIGSASFRTKSFNSKLSPILRSFGKSGPRLIPQAPFTCSTYVSIDKTCPDACPFKNGGCFVKAGATKKLAKALDLAARGRTADEVIAEEARVINLAFRRGVPQDGARGGRDLRLHVGGDVVTGYQAQLLGAASENWLARGGGKVWTYTHSWRDLARSDWGEAVSVLASVERPEDIQAARDRGYAAAIVVDAFPSKKAFSLPGTTARIIPCPAERKTARKATCAECRLCLDDRKLLQRNAAIAFESHSPDAGKARKALKLVQLGLPPRSVPSVPMTTAGPTPRSSPRCPPPSAPSPSSTSRAPR